MAIATASKKNDAIHYHEHHCMVEAMAAKVNAGLSCKQKYLSPKFFCDRHGSELFDTTTRLPEYCPARTGIALLRAHAAEMAELPGLHGTLPEPGSSSSRIRLLPEALRPGRYVPMDTSHRHLIDSSHRLTRLSLADGTRRPCRLFAAAENSGQQTSNSWPAVTREHDNDR